MGKKSQTSIIESRFLILLLTLAVAARLVNNHTGKTEWGNIYYKSLVKTQIISNDEALNKLTSKLNAIRKLSCEDKNRLYSKAGK